MLEFDVIADDLARLRFACSPLHEAIASLHAVFDPAAHPMHLPWLREALPRAARLDLAPLRALVPGHDGYVPDFLVPPPDSPLTGLGEELERMRATPPGQVRTELTIACPGGPPPQLRELYRDPARGLDTLAALVERYFNLTLAPNWGRVAAVLEADLAIRARQLAEGGAAALFADLRPALHWRNGRLRVPTRHDALVALEGRGLLLMPSVFGWPSIFAITDPPWQPTVVYPARGVATAWEPAPAAPRALSAALGETRAALLTALNAPTTGQTLARRLGLSPSAISQQIAILRDAGLVTTQRSGRHVLCRRTDLGDRLATRA